MSQPPPPKKKKKMTVVFLLWGELRWDNVRNEESSGTIPSFEEKFHHLRKQLSFSKNWQFCVLVGSGIFEETTVIIVTKRGKIETHRRRHRQMRFSWTHAGAELSQAKHASVTDVFRILIDFLLQVK